MKLIYSIFYISHLAALGGYGVYCAVTGYRAAFILSIIAMHTATLVYDSVSKT